MTPERKAEVLTRLLARSRREWEPIAHILDLNDPDPADEAAALQEAIDAATTPKSAEASMKERIEGLERELEHIRHSVRGARIGLAENGPGWMREWFDGIEGGVTLALHGPSDPDRDRETQAEQVKP